MTMKREAKAKAEKALKGIEPAFSAYSGKRFTPKEYAAKKLGRTQTNAATGTAKKMIRQGWRMNEGGGFTKVTRKV